MAALHIHPQLRMTKGGEIVNIEREELKEDIEKLLEKADYLLLRRIYLILARNTETEGSRL